MINWKDIHLDFTNELQKEWTSNGFTYKETEELIILGLEPTDANYAQWLKNWRWEKKEDKPRDILTRYGSERLRKEYQEYLIKNPRSVYKSKSNAQRWLDQNYPQGECIQYGGRKVTTRSQVEEIHLTELTLKGELDLKDFTYWRGVIVYISLQVDETKLTFKNLPEKAKISLINAQRDINYHYPTKQEREKITNLDIGFKKLEGHLDLTDFINLKKFSCSYNKLTTLNLNNCHKLKTIECSNNQLTEYWQDIHPDFDYSDRAGWEEQGFNKEQTRQWVKAGTLSSSYNYIIWLRDNKQVGLEWVYNNKKEFEDLQKRYKQYGLCSECKEPNIGEKWCLTCQQQDFTQITSGNQKVDAFIQQQQSVATSEHKQLVWIPYEQFTDIKHIADGGFSKVYKAKWGKYELDGDRMVALKSLTNSQNMTTDFLQEIANHKLFSVNDYSESIVIVNCYGISQDPATKNYLMVMEYMEEGSLRQYLQKNNSKLNFENKLENLSSIADGLSKIHSQELVHRDLHSGNILNSVGWSYITDLGLAKPANETDQSNIYGVIPYIAPEVLRGKPYTQKADIYSFGIIVYELLANAYPYYEYKDLDDVNFALKIIDGHRPNLDKVPIPQSLKDLIARCWDKDPEKRPNAGELERITFNWWSEINRNAESEFNQQYLAIKDEYNNFSQNTPYKIHSNAVTTSKMIDTKKITELISSKMSSLDLSKIILNYNNYHSTELDFDIEIGSKKKTKAENNYQTQELNFDIETPTFTEITKRLRSLSMEETNQKETKSAKLERVVEEKETQEEPMEIDNYQTQIEQSPK